MDNEKIDLKDFLLPLEKQVKESNVSKDDFDSALRSLNEAKLNIQQMLFYARDGNEDLNTLYHQLAEDNFSTLVDELNQIGKWKRSILGKAFENMGYRLLEQTRAGKRDDVMHGIMRIYLSHGMELDKKLLIAFKHPNTEMFKVLIFSFLSGAIKPKTDLE
jgi:hypothetical protein